MKMVSDKLGDLSERRVFSVSNMLGEKKNRMLPIGVELTFKSVPRTLYQ